MLGSHMIKSWSLNQAVVSLSSGEADYYASVRGVAIDMGIRSMLQEMCQRERNRYQDRRKRCNRNSKEKRIGKGQAHRCEPVMDSRKSIFRNLPSIKSRNQRNIIDVLTKNVSRQEMEWHMAMTHQEFK